jgi:hypothetical protein
MNKKTGLLTFGIALLSITLALAADSEAPKKDIAGL